MNKVDHCDLRIAVCKLEIFFILFSFLCPYGDKVKPLFLYKSVSFLKGTKESTGRRNAESLP